MHTNERTPCIYLAAHRRRKVAPTGASEEIGAISREMGVPVARNTWVIRGCVYEIGMRIRTDGDYAHCLDTIESAVDALDENIKTAAVLATCEHARLDRQAK